MSPSTIPSTHLVFLVLVLFVGAAGALQCHVVATGNLSVTDSSGLTDCPLGSLTCVKIVDFTRNTYTKQCQSLNCTMNGQTNAVANCQNTSMIGVSSVSCCCYGDGCNMAPDNSLHIIAGSIVLAAISKLSIFH
ncbi:unnamed protein product [Caenorhabditis auriculariae]|uniref:UPAR/Ly6 domain-containing protein n=1 Tax=Caenorhabditis auriculariae TaxID=2777116 RepID=A0A8S1GWC4_9PELO|nr:unnamed protein product [Caenorhabditis auriculariae]